MATTNGATALAERPARPASPSTLPIPRRTVAGDALPAVRATQYLHPMDRPAEGELSGLAGAITDLAVSPDGRRLVAAHYGDDAVSVIDATGLTVTATVTGIAEPSALAIAQRDGNRVYARSANVFEDTVVAIDLNSAATLAAREVGVGAAGLAAGPSGDLLYVVRAVDAGVEIAVIDVESGAIRTIPVTEDAAASIDALRINSAGTRLYVAVNTASGGDLLVVDLRSGRVQTAPVGATIGDIAVQSDDRRIFVTGWDPELGGVLRVIDTASGRVLRSVAVDGLPIGAVSSANRVYLGRGEEVLVVDAATLATVNRIDIGRPVSCLAIGRDGTRLYVGDFSGALTALAVQPAGQDLRAAS